MLVYAVVNLEFNKMVFIVEGEIQEFCVSISNDSIERERNDYIFWTVLPNSNTSGNVNNA